MFAAFTNTAPMLSAILLLIAGVLVGYALSYPFRSEEEGHEDELHSLRLRNDELESTLRSQRASYSQLEQKLADHRSESDSLQYNSQSLVSQLREHQSEQQGLQTALDEMRVRRDELLDELDRERQSKADLVNSLSTTQTQILASTEEVAGSRQTIAGLENEIDSLRSRLSDAEEQLETTRSRTEDELASNSRVSERYREVTEQLDTERARYAELQSSFAVVEERAKAAENQFEREQQQTAEYREQVLALQEREQDFEKRKLEFQKREQEFEQLSEQNHGQYDAERQQLESTLEQKEREIERLEQELATANYTVDETTNETIGKLRESVETLLMRVADREKQRDEALACLDHEQQQRMALDNMLRHRDTQLQKHEGSAAELKNALQTINHLQTSLEQTNARLQRTVAEREDIEKHFGELKLVHSDSTSEIANHQRALETLERQRDEAENKLEAEAEKTRQLTIEVEHKTELASQSHQQLQSVEAQLRQSEIERNEVEARLNEDAAQLNYARTELKQTETQLETVRQQREETLEALFATQEKAKAYDQLAADFEEHKQAADAMRTEFDTTLSELKEARQIANEATRLEHDVEQYRIATEQMKRMQEEAIAELREEQAKSQELQAKLSSVASSGKQTEDELRTLKPLRFELTAVQKRLESTVEQLKRIRAERDEALRLRNAAQAAVSDIESELRQTQQATMSLSPTGIAGPGLDAEIERLRSMLADTENQLSSARTQLNQREGLMVTLADQKASESDRLRSALDDTRQELRTHGNMIQELREQLADRTETIAHLKQDRDELLLRLNNSRRDSQVFVTDTGPEVEHHQVRGMLYKAAPADADDLKLISGIAEKLEQRLNDFGIYTYEQIMNWDPKAVEEFCRLLTFRDRIERDDWIGQAQQLHEQKHGSRKRSA